MANEKLADLTLRDECKYFVEKIFRKEASPRLLLSYENACKKILADHKDSDEKVQQIIDEAFKRNSDIEAIEYVLRIRRRRNLLTEKFQVLSFLAETDLNLATDYRPKQKNLLAALLTLSLYTLLSVFKFVKGTLYLRFFSKYRALPL